VEAEAMKLDGYQIEEVRPWEAASGGKAIRCLSPRQQCSASFSYEGKPGWYDVSIRYFDQNNGASRFKVFIASKLVAEWVAGDMLPTNKMDAHSSTRRRIRNLALRPLDEIRIEGFPDRGEGAPIDYIEIHSSKR
jgi:alpha-glucuronidase